jgi:subtilisin family serine protease
MRAKRTLRQIVVIFVVLSFLVVGMPGAGTAIAADGQVIDLHSIEKPTKGHPKLESVLSQLAETAQSKGPAAAAAFARQRDIRLVDNRATVTIEALPGKVDGAMSAAKALGARIDASQDNLIRVIVPAIRLTTLANNPAIRLVRLPWKPVPLAMSEGVSLVDADDWHTAGFTGSGVKVGIVDVGFAGYTGLLGTELPSSVTTMWYGSGGTAGSNKHGTACAEIIYDMAPDADFYLTNVDDAVDFGNAVDWLIGQGVDVISCSLGWVMTGPGDGTGPVSGKVTAARTAGILWANSAGNQAQRNWVGTWLDSDGDGIHDFNPGVDETNAIYAVAGYSIIIGLRWNEVWGFAANDYDLYLLNSDTSAEVAHSWNEQNGNDEPIEAIAVPAPYTGYYHIVIVEYAAAAPVTFQLFTFDWNLQYQTASQSIMEPADSADAMAVGAVHWNYPTTVEVFSSQGPSADGRTKPDIVAQDAVTTSPTGYGPSNGLPYKSGGTGFFGTSASAPHVAGAAALVKQANPSFTPAQTQSFLESRAIDLGTAGKDNVFGSGRLDLGTPPVPPSVTTDAANAVTTSTATLNGTLGDLGTASSVNVSFEWGNTTAYGTETTPQAMTGIGAFSAGISSLDPGTTYHCRAKAVGDGTDYGGNETFTTGTEPPSVTTQPAIDVTSASADMVLLLNALGTASSVDISFQWATDDYYTSHGNSYEHETPGHTTGTGGTWGYTLDGILQPDTTYHFRAKAVGDGTDYGDDETFETCLPGDANEDGIVDGRDVIRVKKMILGLEPENCNADANEDGVIDGRDVIRIKKMVLGIEPPSVTTNPATAVTSSGATLNGNMTDLGSAVSAEVSFEWGLTTAYGAETPPQTMASAGSFSANLPGLDPGTAHHFRAKAVGADASYGDDMGLTTLVPGPDLVITEIPLHGEERR